MSPAKVAREQKRGFIVAVGGAEDKVGPAEILRRFVEVSGGKSARIAIIPTPTPNAFAPGRDTGHSVPHLNRARNVGLHFPRPLTAPWIVRRPSGEIELATVKFVGEGLHPIRCLLSGRPGCRMSHGLLRGNSPGCKKKDRGQPDDRAHAVMDA